MGSFIEISSVFLIPLCTFTDCKQSLASGKRKTQTKIPNQQQTPTQTRAHTRAHTHTTCFSVSVGTEASQTPWPPLFSSTNRVSH